MNMCRHHGIELWQIERNELFTFSIYAKDYKKIKELVKKTGIRPRIHGKFGLPFLYDWLKRNWTFSTGFLFFYVLLMIMSSYVWDVSFQGNITYTKETLLKTVNEMGIHRGMKRSRLVCDEIEKAIREKYSDISWVSAEEKGSLLVISIKEAQKTETKHEGELPCHLVSVVDGVVQQISVNRGTAVVKKGQKVKKGDILIEGLVDVTDDSDQVVEKIPVAAKGSVTIYAEHTISQEIPVKKKVKNYTGRKIQLYDWQLFGNTICIKNPLKQFNNSYKYDIMGTKKVNYKIQPFSFSIEMDQYQCREYQWKTIHLTEKQLYKEGMQRYDRMKREITEAGYKVLTHSARIKKKDKLLWELTGYIGYVCDKVKKKYIQEQEWQIPGKAEEEKNGET